MPAIRFEHVREDLIVLAHRGQDVSAFSQAAARVLRRAVPFDGFCMLTLDPATLLPTGEVVENGLPPGTRPRMAEIEIAGNDFNKFPALPGPGGAPLLSARLRAASSIAASAIATCGVQTALVTNCVSG